MSANRSEYLAKKLREFEEWADRVAPEDLKVSGRSEEMARLLDDDPEVDRLIEEARRAALRKRGSA